MNGNSESLRAELTPHLVMEEARLHGWTLKSLGAVFGLAGGMMTALLGSIITAMTWITGPKWHGLFLQWYGTALLFLTIPLLIFGAHCLDLQDASKDAKSTHKEIKVL